MTKGIKWPLKLLITISLSNFYIEINTVKLQLKLIKVKSENASKHLKSVLLNLTLFDQKKKSIIRLHLM